MSSIIVNVTHILFIMFMSFLYTQLFDISKPSCYHFLVLTMSLEYQGYNTILLFFWRDTSYFSNND